MRKSSLALCLASASLIAVVLGACGEVDTGPSAASLTSRISALREGAPDDRYIVTFVGARRASAIKAAGGKLAVDLPARSAVAAYLPGEALETIVRSSEVVDIEPDVRRYPMGEAVPYGISMVEADQVPVRAGTGRVPVCVIDSGIMADHDDFAGLPLSGTDANTGPWSTDHCGHGTHVAGTIAATTGNDLGVASVASDAVSLHIVKVFGDNCRWTYSSTLVAALDACVASRARVVNMSLGGSRSSHTESQAFSDAYQRGVLSIAAAGNAGTGATSYPASYSDVVSVAAVDSASARASFSQHNTEVELAAPGVGVLSTYPSLTSLDVGGTAYRSAPIQFATGEGQGPLVHGGLCDAVGSWSGATVLCERGAISFHEKVINAQDGGAVGVVIYNNAPGMFRGTLGQGNASDIPAVSISGDDGASLLQTGLGLSTHVISGIYDSGYAALSGTSMAAPHVAAVAALVWSQVPGATSAQIREALTATAIDLGAPGRDDLYGYGLVQARAARDYLVPDCSRDGVCTLDCAPRADPDCKGPRLDCSDDGYCNVECPGRKDPDCRCRTSGARCFDDADCCEGSCVASDRSSKTICQ